MDIRIASRDQTNVTRWVTGLKPEKVKVDRFLGFFTAAPNPLNFQYSGLGLGLNSRRITYKLRYSPYSLSALVRQDCG